MASATRRDTASSRRRRARLSTVPSFTPADSLVQPADDDGGGGGGRDDKDGLLLGAGDRASLGWWASGGSSNGLGAADMVHARWSLVSKIPDCLHVSNHEACHSRDILPGGTVLCRLPSTVLRGSSRTWRGGEVSEQEFRGPHHYQHHL